MSSEQFDVFMRQLVDLIRGGAGSGHAGRLNRRVLEEKSFGRIEKFSHGEDTWPDWSFDMKIAVGAQCPEMRILMDFVEGGGEKSLAAIMSEDPEGSQGGRYVGLEKVTNELYEMLVLVTEGEAKLLVKSVAECEGLVAWSRQHTRYTGVPLHDSCECTAM